MNKKQITSLAFSLLLLGQFSGGVSTASAGFDLKDTTDSKGGDTNVGEGNFSRQKFTITSDIRFGYDDNPLAQPDHVTFGRGALRQTFDQDTEGSAFFNADLGVAYTAATTRLTLTIGGDVGVTYYFDREGRNYDINGGLTGRLTYKATPRLFIEVNSYNAYVSQGDYGATTLTGFNSVFGNAARGQTSADINGDYFYTSDGITATYQLTQRVSLATSGSLVAFAYEDEPYTTDQDRIELYFQEEMRYLLLPQLTLAADYRFGYIDYFSVSNDSYTNFLLGGVDYVFNPRLKGSVRAGVEFRNYFDAPGDEVSPYAEASVTYDLSRVAHLSFLASYGIEEGDLSTDNTKANTVRLGINYEQNITSRISLYGGFYFTHARYNTPVRTDAALIAYAPDNFNEDTFDVSAGARYAINRHFSVEIGYTHTSVTSDVDARAYERNRYFGGVRIQF